MDDNSNRRLLCEDIPVEGSKNQIGGAVTCMSENSESWLQENKGLIWLI